MLKNKLAEQLRKRAVGEVSCWHHDPFCTCLAEEMAEIKLFSDDQIIDKYLMCPCGERILTDEKIKLVISLANNAEEFLNIAPWHSDHVKPHYPDGED